jgi:hypothetical protein
MTMAAAQLPSIAQQAMSRGLQLLPSPQSGSEQFSEKKRIHQP